jgi:predicted transcriptional regulator
MVSENGAYDIIISIKPAYADMILNGKKKYEFRKHSFTKPIGKALIYSTKPMSKIVGYFTVDKVLKNTPAKIWAQCYDSAGISENKFVKYFEGSKTACAIKIKSVFQFNNPIRPYDIIKNFNPPRSFRYINKAITNSLVGY